VYDLPDGVHVREFDKVSFGESKMIYITGDTHGDFRRVEEFCQKHKTSRGDIMIILGDAGINYYGGKRTKVLKTLLSDISITLFCLHGNHENRPQNIPTYREAEWHGGTVFVEDEFPSLLFAKDGEIYDLGGKSA
jgi:3-oxoacid CoA-transferase subunit A